MNMYAVGIDVSKRKSTVAILRPGGKVVVKPFDVPHLAGHFQSLKDLISGLVITTAQRVLPQLSVSPASHIS